MWDAEEKWIDNIYFISAEAYFRPLQERHGKVYANVYYIYIVFI